MECAQYQQRLTGINIKNLITIVTDRKEKEKTLLPYTLSYKQNTTIFILILF